MKNLKNYFKELQFFLYTLFSINNGTKERIRKKMKIILNDVESSF